MANSGKPSGINICASPKMRPSPAAIPISVSQARSFSSIWLSRIAFWCDLYARSIDAAASTVMPLDVTRSLKPEVQPCLEWCENGPRWVFALRQQPPVAPDSDDVPSGDEEVSSHQRQHKTDAATDRHPYGEASPVEDCLPHHADSRAVIARHMIAASSTHPLGEKAS